MPFGHKKLFQRTAAKCIKKFKLYVGFLIMGLNVWKDYLKYFTLLSPLSGVNSELPLKVVIKFDEHL